MQDDFDDGGMDLPDDDLTGGGEIGDLEHGDHEGVDLDMGAGGEPAGRPSGGARAHAGGGSKPAPRKSASRARKGAAKKSGGARKSGARKGASKGGRKSAGARKGARKGGRKKGRRR